MDVLREEHGISYCGQTVAVLGNYGLLGQWLVRRLLEKGYNVHSALGCSPGNLPSLQISLFLTLMSSALVGSFPEIGNPSSICMTSSMDR